MIRIQDLLVQEIKINKDYCHLNLSDYEKSTESDKSKPIIINKTILTEEYVRRLTNNMDANATIYPPNCRYIEKTSRGTIVIIEEPPSVRTVFVNISAESLVNDLRKENKVEKYGYKKYLNELKKSIPSFNLAFPYTIFFFFFNRYNELNIGYTFLRTTQMTGFSDVLLKNPMLNINSSQKVCLGDRIYKKYNSLYSAVQNTLDVWYSSVFNFDFRDNHEAYKETPIIKNYLEWEYYSKMNPLFVFDANWILHKYNIYEMLQYVKGRCNGEEQKRLTYTDMVKIFTTPTETGVQEKASKTSKRTYNLFYDIAQTVYLNSSITLNVGDPLIMKNGESAFVNSFIGFADGGDVKYIQIEKGGKLFLMKYSEAFKKYILKQITESRFSESLKLPSGEIVKPGDIIRTNLKGSEYYQKIDYIRKSRMSNESEEVFELKCGNYYYYSNEIDIKLINIEEPELCGIKLKKGVEYILPRGDLRNNLTPASKVTYEKVDITRDGILTIVFNNISPGLESNIKIKLDNKSQQIFPMDENIRHLPNIFRLGRTVFQMIYNSKNINHGAWAYKGSILYENSYYLERPSPEKIKNLVNKDTFFVAGPDFDTEFTIGDKVVVANWGTPIEVLNVKTIHGFKYDDKTGNIYFVLQNIDGKLTEELYVDGHSSYIKTGYIRRVTNKFDKLSVGTKIIAKETGHSNFPKKDTNIVVAIITDGPYEPLVLCSNGCTLWYSTVMSDFETISMKSKRWESLQHVPLDISKIKFQAGDIINGRSTYARPYGYVIHDPSTTRYLKVLPLVYYHSFSSTESFDKYFMNDAIFDCIPTPRLTIPKQQELGTVQGALGFHGGVIENKQDGKMIFLNERRGMNV